MKKIKENFSKNGMDYTLISRVKDIALYKQSHNGLEIGFEVHKVSVAEQRVIASKVIPSSEYIACNNKFGKTGFYYRTMKEAESKIAELLV